MTEEAQPVKIEGQAGPVKVEIADAPKLAPKGTSETASTTTVKTSGEQPQAPAPAIVADDSTRKWLAVGVLAQFLVVVGYIIYSSSKGQAAGNVEMYVLGAENIFMTFLLNYYYGSSSGSTASHAALLNKP